MNYENSGVNIERGNAFVSIIKDVSKNENIGGFSGIYDYNGIKLAAATDGVGTKLQLCKTANKYDTIGIDLVAMCVNDLLCQGAKPLFFLDYYATGELDLNIGKDIIQGIQKGCEESNCILLGGETAEMPMLYKGKDFDLAGFCVGVIEGDIYPKTMNEGDLIYGIKSNGIHSNGFSLINNMLNDNSYDIHELLTPTKIYFNEITYLINKYGDKIKGFSHITGGGITDNIPRIINDNLSMNINQTWEIPEVFKWIYSRSDMKIEDMFKTYNCGIGMVVVFDKSVDINIDDELIHMGNIIRGDLMIHYDNFLKEFN